MRRTSDSGIDAHDDVYFAIIGSTRMRATNFEFRYRFFVIGIVFWAGFSCYAFDHMNAVEGLVQYLGLSGAVPLRSFFFLGTAAVATGAAIRTWATAYLSSRVVHDMNLHSDQLVADGPYRYVRNPLYLGILFLSVGMGLMASRLGWFVIVAGTFLFYWRLILREESALAETQGQAFVAFQQSVPRLIPAVTPRVPSSGRRPLWLQAFKGESFMWAFTAASLAFAITLNPKLTYGITALAAVGYATDQMLNRRTKSSGA